MKSNHLDDWLDTLAALSQAQEADEALRVGARALWDMLRPDCVAAYLSNGTELVPLSLHGIEEPALRPVRVRHAESEPPPWGDVGCWGAGDRPAWLGDTRGIPGEAVLWIPLSGAGADLGGLLIAGPADLLTREEGHVVALARVVAMAVERATLRRSISEADRMKVEIVTLLSHQMRTPLASVKGYATALLLQGDQYDEATRREFLEAIDEEADHLARLIGDLLESSAIEAGLLEVEPQPVLLPAMAREIARDVQGHVPGHHLSVHFPDGFPVIFADPSRLEQVLRNLMDNAVKYSPDGGLIVVRGGVRPHEVEVSVADQGVGIAPEHLNRLFERFFRIKGNLRRPVAGTGLGLPIARAIVEAHGGRIWAESAVGHGSVFYFTLPLDAAEDEEAE